jgi:hypothetical protein
MGEESNEFVDKLEEDSVVPLCVIAWDRNEQSAIVAMADDGWDQLDQSETEAVLQHIAGLALDFAPFMGDPEFE